MKLIRPWKSFFNSYFTVNNLIYGFVSALFYSFFIYLDYFQMSNLFFNSFFAIIGSYMLLFATRKQLFFSGFFIGFLWFYWIGLSFRFYELTYLIPFVIFIICLVYAVLFWLIGFLEPIFRVFIFPSLSFISFLGFDWLRSEAVFADTIFGVSWWQMSIVFFTLFLFRYKKYALLLLIFALDFNYALEISNHQIKLITTHVTQEKKWNKSMLNSYKTTLFNEIQNAKNKNYEAVVFPESFLPTYLNRDEALMHRLKQSSQDIVIITGALYYEKDAPKNSTYIFNKGTVSVAHKVVLVPFGEANPLPEFLSDFVNKVFFDGALDYTGVDMFTTYEIKNHTYKNAICYEATDASLYKENEQNIIALSNNAWFIPSVQPILQKILLKVFVKKYNVTILHSINGANSYTLTQGKRWLF